MPGGIEHPVIGSLVFTAVKLGGYTWAGHMLNRQSEPSVSPLRIGIARTLIGIAFGGAVFGFTGLVNSDALTSAAYIVLLAPVRFLEWWLLVRWMYGPERRVTAKAYALLVGLSYLLDVPAVIGLFVTGGFWIC
jgi:hypothetical protein